MKSNSLSARTYSITPLGIVLLASTVLSLAIVPSHAQAQSDGELTKTGKQTEAITKQKQELKPIQPNLNIDIPDLRFTDPSTLSAKIKNGAKGFSIPFLGEYISGIYTYGVGIISILGMIALVVGGIMYAAAAGNSERVELAKSIITNSFIGIGIAAGSYLLLYIIDPNLVELKNVGITVVEKEEFDYDTEEMEQLSADSPVTAADKVENPTGTDHGSAASAGTTTGTTEFVTKIVPYYGKTVEAWTSRSKSKTMTVNIPSAIPEFLPADPSDSALPAGFTSVNQFNNKMAMIGYTFGDTSLSAKTFCNLKAANKSTNFSASAFADSKYFGALDCAGNYGPRSSINYLVLHNAGASAFTTTKNWRQGSIGRYKKKKDGTWYYWRKPIASHFFIEASGKTYQLADTKLHLRHCCGKNKTSVGVDLQPNIYKVKGGPKGIKGKKFNWYKQSAYNKIKKIADLVGVPMTNDTIISHCGESPGRRVDPNYFSWEAIGLNTNHAKHKCTWSAQKVNIAKQVKAEVGDAKFEEMCPKCPI